MWKVLGCAIAQSLLLVGGQVFLKAALQRMPTFGWTSEFWIGLLQNWRFAVCGIFFGVSSVLWMYIVKTYEFSTAYPMVSLSYVFGMFAAMFFFGETISVTKWIGVALIVGGCFLIAK